MKYKLKWELPSYVSFTLGSESHILIPVKEYNFTPVLPIVSHAISRTIYFLVWTLELKKENCQQKSNRRNQRILKNKAHEERVTGLQILHLKRSSESSRRQLWSGPRICEGLSWERYWADVFFSGRTEEREMVQEGLRLDKKKYLLQKRVRCDICSQTCCSTYLWLVWLCSYEAGYMLSLHICWLKISATKVALILHYLVYLGSFMHVGLFCFSNSLLSLLQSIR